MCKDEQERKKRKKKECNPNIIVKYERKKRKLHVGDLVYSVLMQNWGLEVKG